MTNTLITKKTISGVVLEFRAIITPNDQDREIVLMLHLIGEVDDGLLGLTLALEEINPSERHQTIFLPTKTSFVNDTKEINMEKLQDPL